MREIKDQKTVELKFDVQGNFTEFEANDLKNFIHTYIIGKQADYKGIMQRFCDEKGYGINFVGTTVYIFKPDSK